MWAKHSGFTIVELLIVVVVIGILAAVAFVSYSGAQTRAQNAAVQSDLAEMARKVGIEAVEPGRYQPVTAATGIKVTRSAYDVTENNLYYCRNTTTNEYAIGARSKSRKQYKVVNGTVSEHGSLLYGADTCALVGTTTAGISPTGWEVNTLTWASWAQE